jgi:hypothetical protein
LKAAFAGLSLTATAAASVLSLYAGDAFHPYFGNLPPPLAVGLAAVLGAICLHYLQTRERFDVYPADTARAMLVSTALALCFAAAVILVDIAFGYPRDINVPPPWSLLFYPVMGFVAQIVLHIAPFALLLALSAQLVAKPARERRLWPCIVLASLLEPAFQWRAASAGALSWADLYTVPHVFVFGLFELWIFRRYGYASMYAFRLAYYLCWHIVWGYVRLHVLF